MASSSQNATFEHCISHWMPRPRVSGPIGGLNGRERLTVDHLNTLAVYAAQCLRSKINTVPLRFILPGLSQFLKQPQQDQPLLF
jgi:hypothetical protein